MRFRESPPNSRLTTLCCILHPAICISHKVLAQVEVGESIDLVRVSPLVLLHQYPLPACLFVPVASVLAATICQSSFSLGPRPPTGGQSTFLRRKPSSRAPTKVGGLRSCSVIHQPFKQQWQLPSNLLRPGKGSNFVPPGPDSRCAG